MRVPFASEREILSTWSLRGQIFITVALLLSFLLLEDVWSIDETLPSFQSRASHGNGLARTARHRRLETTTTIKSCLDPDGPQPFILMSLGRSGSGSTYQIIGNLTGMETPPEYYTGKDPIQSTRFFSSIQNDYGLWVTDNLCKKQREYSSAGLIGFRWKPWESIFSDPALDGLGLIAKSQNPTIKVIRVRRNLLDVWLSIQKHRQGGFKQGHCEIGNKKCFKKHLRAGTNMTISIDETLEYLETMTLDEDNVDALLDGMNVPHLHVTYDELYRADNAEEWMKIFEFVGVGPAQDLTLEHVKSVMKTGPTSSDHHRDSVSNFDELKEALQGTNFEDLLHP